MSAVGYHSLVLSKHKLQCSLDWRPVASLTYIWTEYELRTTPLSCSKLKRYLYLDLLVES